jgi:hypothetical protein
LSEEQILKPMNSEGEGGVACREVA